MGPVSSIWGGLNLDFEGFFLLVHCLGRWFNVPWRPGIGRSWKPKTKQEMVVRSKGYQGFLILRVQFTSTWTCWVIFFWASPNPGSLAGKQSSLITMLLKDLDSPSWFTGFSCFGRQDPMYDSGFNAFFDSLRSYWWASTCSTKSHQNSR